MVALWVAAAAMVLVGLRPWRLSASVWPVAGALIVVGIGAEPGMAALQAIARQWNVLLFILGLMGLAAAAEESGAFAWITDVVLERARGSRRRLFVLLFLTGAGLTLVLSNDATAIVLTPIVYRAIAKRGGDAMPFLFACTFVADTASFGLPFANPANVLILPHAQLLPYLIHLGPPQIAAIGLNLALFLAIFRSQLKGRYAYEPARQPPGKALRTLVALGAVGVAYVVALVLRVPLGLVAFVGSAVVLAVARVPVRAAVRHVSWSTFALLAGLFALIDAVARAGWVDWALRAVESVARSGSLAADTVTAVGAALFSNVFNNLPIAVASSYLVAHGAAVHAAYPLIVGVDLGPNLTTSGSLATILWLAVLRKRGVRVNAFEYFKLGAVVVPVTIAVTVLYLWIVP